MQVDTVRVRMKLGLSGGELDTFRDSHSGWVEVDEAIRRRFGIKSDGVSLETRLVERGILTRDEAAWLHSGRAAMGRAVLIPAHACGVEQR